jgi:cytoskeleton protein RodZ
MAPSDDDQLGRGNSDQDEDSNPDADADSEPGLGARLKAAREAQDLTIEEVAAELRIAVPNLHALEHGAYDTIGAPVFAKGYLKQYAARLRLNVADVVADYERAVGNQSADFGPSRTITLRDDRQITVWIVAALVLGSLAAIIWFWWWLGTDNAELPAVITRDAEPAPAFDEPVTRSPAPVETRLPAPTSTPPASPEVQRASVPAVSPGAVTADDTDPETELDAATGRAPAAEVYSGPELEIVFVADSWTEIIAESGERLFYNLGHLAFNYNICSFP